jgi:hypothetical protein
VLVTFARLLRQGNVVAAAALSQLLDHQMLGVFLFTARFREKLSGSDQNGADLRVKALLLRCHSGESRNPRFNKAPAARPLLDAGFYTL